MSGEVVMRRPCIAGNWKMHGSINMARALCAELGAARPQLEAVEVVVCPAFTLLATVQQALGGGIALGAQDVDAHASGAFTGQVAASMLVEQGCTYVIVGHSERRTLFGESDQMVAAKAGAAIEHGLLPIICIGETQLERQRGETEQVLARQLNPVLPVLNAHLRQHLAAALPVIAYEPVWAIGSGCTATPEQAQQVHTFVRGLVAAVDSTAAAAVRIIYGGSMQPHNAAQLLAQPDIDGGLLGGAALRSAEFLAICQAAANAAAKAAAKPALS